MAKFFRRLLMMAAESGIRYARAILRLVMGLRANATQSPGTNMALEQESHPAIIAKGSAYPIAAGQSDARAGIVGLVAKLIAYLIANGILRAEAGTIPMEADCQAFPGVPGESKSDSDIGMVSEMESNPGIPTTTDSELGTASTAQGATGDPAPTDLSGTTAMHSSGTLTQAATTATDVDCGITGNLMASLVLEIPPELVDGRLYIRQVYHAEQSGTVLRLK